MPQSRRNASPSPSASEPPDDRGRPTTFLGLLALVDRAVQRELQTRLRAYGLSVAEYTCLRMLAVVPGLSNAELARRSLVTPQSMNEVVAKLQLRGLIERRGEPGHGRILRTQLSAVGRAKLEQALPEVEALEVELRGGAGDAEVAQATEHLMGVLERLRTLHQDRP